MAEAFVTGGCRIPSRGVDRTGRPGSRPPAVSGRSGSAPFASQDLVSDVHRVCCPYCQGTFNLFAARWCAHLEGEPSKVCPSCARCLCEHPAYGEHHFWKEAPLAFQRRGFNRLFLFYL